MEVVGCLKKSPIEIEAAKDRQSGGRADHSRPAAIRRAPGAAQGGDRNGAGADHRHLGRRADVVWDRTGGGFVPSILCTHPLPGQTGLQVYETHPNHTTFGASHWLPVIADQSITDYLIQY